MTEMLANRYLRIHRFADALPYLEIARQRRPEDMQVSKKLVLCYAQTGHLDAALNLMTTLMEQHPEAVVHTDDESEGIPSHHAVEITRRRASVLPPGVFHATLGLELLYHDESEALKALDRAADETPESRVHHLRDVVAQHVSGPGRTGKGPAMAAVLALAVGLALTGCSEEAEEVAGGDHGAGSSCIECHADQARLQATADPDPGGGEGDPGEG